METGLHGTTPPEQQVHAKPKMKRNIKPANAQRTRRAERLDFLGPREEVGFVGRWTWAGHPSAARGGSRGLGAGAWGPDCFSLYVTNAGSGPSPLRAELSGMLIGACAQEPSSVTP